MSVVRPDVGTVVAHVEGNVTEEAHAFFGAVLLKVVPLPEEHKLQKLFFFDRLSEFLDEASPVAFESRSRTSAGHIVQASPPKCCLKAI